ncbi:MAG TPA: type II toxin-antitoxin system RelE/ParE family toxin [Hyphomicrobiaceae bacterium]|nr:type II toxin-antitoxin system RelE/ParE family toxin [Hyphomicrobiaceae bacterium]
MIEVREYIDAQGQSPYGEWFKRLSSQAAAKIAIAVTRMSHGNVSNVKGVGEGVMERKIDWGPGYRVYFAWDGSKLIVLLGRRQQEAPDADIAEAKACWQDYRTRKRN